MACHCIMQYLQSHASSFLERSFWQENLWRREHREISPRSLVRFISLLSVVYREGFHDFDLRGNAMFWRSFRPVLRLGTGRDNSQCSAYRSVLRLRKARHIATPSPFSFLPCFDNGNPTNDVSISKSQAWQLEISTSSSTSHYLLS